MTQGEAAKSLGLSPAGMKSRVRRGRTKLKEVLLDCCHVEIGRRGGSWDTSPATGNGIGAPAGDGSDAEFAVCHVSSILLTGR
jgi:RNA polymerase sigma-70 factor (ECF subfamily)